jgi:hypothetical protein
MALHNFLSILVFAFAFLVSLCAGLLCTLFPKRVHRLVLASLERHPKSSSLNPLTPLVESPLFLGVSVLGGLVALWIAFQLGRDLVVRIP